MTHRLFSGMGFGLRFCSALVDDAVSVMNVPVILWILVRSIFLKCWWLTRNEVEYLRIQSGTGYIRSQVRQPMKMLVVNPAIIHSAQG